MKRLAILFAWWFLVQAPYDARMFTVVGPFSEQGECDKVRQGVNKRQGYGTTWVSGWCWWGIR